MPSFDVLTRRNFLAACGAGLGAAALGRWAQAAPLRQANGQPMNVLFIAIDDLNDWVGTLKGHPQARTPNLDRLMSTGVEFRRAYCAAPACGPSRAALMTGIRPATSGCVGNPHSFTKNPILDKAVSLPQAFRNAGYEVLGAGKLYHGAHMQRELKARDFDEYWPGPDHPHGPEGAEPSREDRPLNGGIPRWGGHWDFGPLDADFGDMSDAKTARWAVKNLHERRFDRPFFMGVGIFRPHLPWYVPKKYYDMFPLESVQLPEIDPNDLNDVPASALGITNRHEPLVKAGKWKDAVQAYLASTAFMDDCIGVLLDGLDSSPHRDNTIVVLWSDHGWQHGQKERWAKFTLWEQGTRNPMFWRVPGVTRAGGHTETPVNLLDIYPTLASLCGLSTPAGQLEGYDLTPLLRDPGAAWEKPSLTTFAGDNHSVRSRDYRYIRYADGAEELYDHRVDPLEHHNLAGDPAYASVMAEHVKWMPRHPVPDAPTMAGKGGDE